MGRGIVTSDYMFDESIEDDYKNTRLVNWTDIGEWETEGQQVVKVLTDITPYTDYVKQLNAMFEDEDVIEDEKEIIYPKYSEIDFLNEEMCIRDRYTSLCLYAIFCRNQ